eukprot:CAMPEP_0180334390 /NCGR_PEP_ID=MMETSP0988-20121125/43653_1 /TAXON_ID=697907 /ORGANISM="non described non described, Strain CCMP2293" /LENGTH=79 /DNA_ID=CAMNT_0022322325 /DNA_START=294 /DNA_END=529 /DNA_ORIENTATION=+
MSVGGSAYAERIRGVSESPADADARFADLRPGPIHVTVSPGSTVAPEPSKTVRVVVELQVHDGEDPSVAAGWTESAHAT